MAENDCEVELMTTARMIEDNDGNLTLIFIVLRE